MHFVIAMRRHIAIIANTFINFQVFKKFQIFTIIFSFKLIVYIQIIWL